MITVLNESDQVSIPSWVTDLVSFRRWADADDFPEAGRVIFLKGEVWVDMSMQQVFSHVLVKTQYAIVLGGMVQAEKGGTYLVDGVLLTNVEADIAVIPDGTFIANDTLRAGAVRLVEGREEGYVELDGTPDMVLEVISRSSVYKDTVLLRQAYWEAGIREYWLVDARGDALTFDILKHTTRGYVATRKQNGWLKSAVFGKSFRLDRHIDGLGNPEYRLVVR